MKNVYFVRHGESTTNVGETGLGTDNAALTSKGKEQAQILTKRLKNISIDHIIQSNLLRAQQTAAAIARVVPVPVTTSELFRERTHPSEVIGKHRGDPEAEKIWQTITENFQHSGWRFSDEENFEDQFNRARKALAFLEQHDKGNILIVTHALFLKVLVGVILLGESMTVQEFVRLSNSLVAKNTGITLCEYDGTWRLITWSDHAHLGEY